MERTKRNKFNFRNSYEIKMPQAENGISEAKRFINVWTIYNDIEAIDLFYNSLQEDFKIYCNLPNDKTAKEKMLWVMECEKLLAKARNKILQKNLL
tara:strand:+ start:155 stop:442 length:288 start_codon:yes stop_codon:yes gene_type:complete